MISDSTGQVATRRRHQQRESSRGHKSSGCCCPCLPRVTRIWENIRSSARETESIAHTHITYHITYHISHITYHISHITLSPITYHISHYHLLPITYHISHITSHHIISYTSYHESHIIYHISYILYHIIYHIISYITYHISYIISYHIISHIISYIISYITSHHAHTHIYIYTYLGIFHISLGHCRVIYAPLAKLEDFEDWGNNHEICWSDMMRTWRNDIPKDVGREWMKRSFDALVTSQLGVWENEFFHRGALTEACPPDSSSVQTH